MIRSADVKGQRSESLLSALGVFRCGRNTQKAVVEAGAANSHFTPHGRPSPQLC